MRGRALVIFERLLVILFYSVAVLVREAHPAHGQYVALVSRLQVGRVQVSMGRHGEDKWHACAIGSAGMRKAACIAIDA